MIAELLLVASFGLIVFAWATTVADFISVVVANINNQQ
jgi:Ca2+/Na+ antiporter